MAITLKGSPNKMTPGYNPMYYYFDSTNKNNLGFRYLVKIKNNNIYTPQTISEVELAPAYFSGFGITNISKIITSQLSQDTFFDNVTTNTAAIYATNSHYMYSLELYEKQLAADWEYDDYEFYTSAGTVYNGYTQLRNFNSGTTHSYAVNDQINIVQADGGALKPSLNGLQTIVAVPAPNIIVINIPFYVIGSGPAISGITSYADNRTVTSALLETYSDLMAINAGVSHSTFMNWDEEVYNLNNGLQNANFLTNAPQGFRVLPYAYVYLNTYSTMMNEATHITFKNSNGDEFETAINTVTNGLSSAVISIAAGPANAIIETVVSGSLPLIKDDTEWYSVAIKDKSIDHVFQVDRRCQINDIEVIFRDRLGSYVPFSFTLHTRINNKIERTTYKQHLGELKIGARDYWGYTPQDRGTKQINADIQKTYTISTPFMNDAESFYFEELVTSPDVYIKLDGEYWAANVVTDSIENKTERRDNLVRYTIDVMLANNDIIPQ